MAHLDLSLDEINAYKESTITILYKQIGILSQLDEILAKEETISQTPKKGILTLKTSAEFKEILNNEIKKLENFDVVLAVVGTMKAGKSTTINAIVGREILPNRNRPMTALPTLICHNPEKVVPSIKINPTVLNEFLRKLKRKLSLITNTDGMHQDMLNLIDFIKKNGQFKSYYESEEDIFNFLYQLNDLVRLSKIIEELDTSDEVIKFPFDEYKNFENLPMIEVAFKLDSNFKTQGRFMLLDTAGPNEAGQDELKEALAQQLERSSAVMIVLDYTQLNSDAEKDVKEQIDKIPTVQKSRLFALVNKFDQKNANADEADATRQHIFYKLLKDKIELDNIYAISAQDAYLANRLLAYIEQYQEKPVYQDDNWVADFAKKMYGRRPESAYSSTELNALEQDIADLYKDSRMQQPMQNVIGNMQRNAPFIAMQSALAGASHVFDNLHNVLDIRGYFAQKIDMSEEEIKQINELISKFDQQITDLKTQKDELAQNINEMKQNIYSELNMPAILERLKDILNKEIDSMFNKISTEAENDLEEKLSWQQRFSNAKDWMFNLRTVDEERELRKKRHLYLEILRDKAQYKDNSNIMIFENKEDCVNFQDEILNVLNRFVADEIQPILNHCIEQGVELAFKTRENMQAQYTQFLENFTTEFSNKDINLHIQLDDINYVQTLSIDNSQINIDTNLRKQTINSNKTGIIGGIQLLFGAIFRQDWGTEEIEYQYYEIKKDSTADLLKEIAEEKLFNPLQQQVEEQIDILLNRVDDAIDMFSVQVSNIIDEITQANQNEQSDYYTTRQEKEAYKMQILSLKRTHEDLQKDWDKISQHFNVEKVKIS